jgi:hypothetical protein
MGQDSDAMRSFAQVEQPHLRHRPVALSAAASHSGQARQISSRAASVSGGVAAKPEAAHFAPAERALSIALRCASMFVMASIKQRLSLDLIPLYTRRNKANGIQ